MRRGRWIASAAAAAMLLSLAAGGNVPAANIRIIGESEEQTETPALTLDGQAGEEAAAVRETESEAEAPDPGKWKRLFAMTSVFSWKNSISLCSASFCTPRPNLSVTPGIS